jgi:hypothetical protein
MRSVVPARRFDALRAFAGAVLPSRLAPDGGPPCAFAPLQRSIAALPHRPAGPKTGTPDDASSPGLLDPSTRAETADPSPRGFGPRGVPRPRFGYLPRGVHRRPSRRLAAPKRPWASPFKAFSSSRWVPLSRPLPSCRSPRRFAAPPWGRADAGAFRASFPVSSSCCGRTPEGTRRVDAFLGFSRPERSLPPSRRPALDRGASPCTRSAA